MKIKLVTALFNIEIKGDLKSGLLLQNEFKITNNKAVKLSLVNKYMEEAAGMLETEAIKYSNAVIYSYKEIEDSRQPQEILVEFLREVGIFLNVLWIIKDNSVNYEMGFIEYYDKGIIKIDSNLMSPIYTCSNGKVIKTVFSKKEIRKAGKFYTKDIEPITDESDYEITPLRKGINRVERAFYFLQSARNQSDMGIKVSDYCTTLEALFSTSSSELAHQLAERIALFLGQNTPAKSKIYGDIKTAYKIRSKIVHGDALKKKDIDQVIDISILCDEYIRQSFSKIRLNKKLSQLFDSSQETLNNYFVELIFK